MTLAKAITKTLDIDVEDVRIDLTATIKSYDLTDTKFIFDIQSSDGLTIDLTGSTAMYIVEYVHDSQTYAIQGDITVVNSTKISFNLPEDLKGYKGTVLIGLYVRLTDGTKIDIKDIAVRIEPSIMDKDIDFSAKTYFKDFESIKAEVILEGEKAKNQINAVLPTIQAQVSELDRQIKALPQIPDLFVAYADDINGGGFSKTDNTKMYKGYGVKNSNLATDYRWERNSSNLQIGGSNLFIDSGFKNKVRTNSSYDINYWYSYVGTSFNYSKFDDDCNYLYFTASNDNNIGVMQFFDTNKLIKGETYSVCMRVKVDQTTTFRYQLAKKNPGNSYNWYFDFSDTTVTSIGEWVDIKWTFTIPKDDDATRYALSLRNFQTGSNTTIQILKPKLEIGNVCTGFSLAHKDLMLNSNPVNSILTTLSAENPSTTLGGTWVQLGTESKFNQTIYYWQRTQ